ncbi:hypothetical protein F2Q69_00035910 [Brassica cretica]|uniref:Uncharacterized protein n=1 Tax=Brassica cretica TaxID=69181 RepID=A0A8S9SGN5_BRACR|nr:hypothetical protein F2Q69_00035910 [Brassica cretica]
MEGKLRVSAGVERLNLFERRNRTAFGERLSCSISDNVFKLHQYQDPELNVKRIGGTEQLSRRWQACVEFLRSSFRFVVILMSESTRRQASPADRDGSFTGAVYEDRDDKLYHDLWLFGGYIKSKAFSLVEESFEL